MMKFDDKTMSNHFTKRSPKIVNLKKGDLGTAAERFELKDIEVSKAKTDPKED